MQIKKPKTIQEYINDDCPFFHVTGMSKLPSIIKYGLRAMRFNAICVVRSQDKSIINEICRQVCENDRSFAVIKIIPSKHGVTADMVGEDGVPEKTTPLHNYIYKSIITIDEDDIIIRDYTIDDSDFSLDITKIEALEGYTRPKCPCTDSNLERLLDEWT